MIGWLKLHRCILESKQFSNPIDLKVWVWLMCKASTQDRHLTLKVGAGFHVVTLKRGQMIFGRSAAEKELKIDGSTVYKIIHRLQDYQDIKIQSNNHFSIITLLNYADYQSSESVEDFEIIDDVTTGKQPDNSNVTATEQQDNSNVTQLKNIEKVENLEKVEKVGASALTNFKKLTEREFYNTIAEFKNDYEKETLRVFFDYWSEKDPKGKMKFQLQKTWEVKKRLVTWKNKENEINRRTFANGNGKLGTSEARTQALENWGNSKTGAGNSGQENF